jgi:hypothetical protein
MWYVTEKWTLSCPSTATRTYTDVSFLIIAPFLEENEHSQVVHGSFIFVLGSNKSCWCELSRGRYGRIL